MLLINLKLEEFIFKKNHHFSYLIMEHVFFSNKIRNCSKKKIEMCEKL